MGILVGFQVSGQDASSKMSADLRERAVDLLLQMKESNPDVLLNSKKSLELFRPSHHRVVARDCIYKSSAISFDAWFRIKMPCTFEGNADAKTISVSQ